jgi:hypothetical protein
MANADMNVDLVDDDAFRVVLNPEFTENAQPKDIEALQREFADWFPAPVLLASGTAVKYKSKSCTVLEHSSDDPQTVLVNIDECSEPKHILYTSLTLSSDEKKSSAEQETQMVGALEDPSIVKFIGYNEFICDGKLEREYWVSIDKAKLPSPLKAGQMPLRQDQSLCVVHVQYNGKFSESSAILRVSIRPTRSIELRSHLDKCVPCRSCKQRRDCKQCQRCRSIFSNLCTMSSRCDSCKRISKSGCKECRLKKKQLCASCKLASADQCPKCWDLCDACMACLACEKCKQCADCEHMNNFTKCGSCSLCDFESDHCRDFKWANRYGQQRLKLPASFEAAPAMDQRLYLTDKHQRRFALLIGNSEYGDASKIYKDLENPVHDVEALAELLKRDEIGFNVQILLNAKKVEMEDCVRGWAKCLPEDATALIYLCGHGCQLKGEGYFVPAQPVLSTHGESEDAVVKNAKDNFVTVRGSILDPVRRVLREAGLIITFWDCCRENELHSNRKIWRGQRLDCLIRGVERLKHHLDEFSSPYDPGEIFVSASSDSRLVFDGAVHSPLMSSLLEVLQDHDLSSRDILDEKIQGHIRIRIFRLTEGKQRPEFIDSRNAKYHSFFSFIKQASSDGEPPEEEEEGKKHGSKKQKIKGQQTKGKKIKAASCEGAVSPARSQASEAEKGEEWDTLPDPVPLSVSCDSPLRVMFIGANTQGTNFQIEKERDDVREKLMLNRGETAWRGKVAFECSCDEKSSGFVNRLVSFNPSILQISCHGELRGLWLKNGLMEDVDIVNFLESLNKDKLRQGQSTLRLLLLNSCMSGSLAQKVSSFVDFVIGHGHSDVKDEDAIEFSKTFWKSLGSGLSLLSSFLAAKLASTPFKLHGRVDQNFFLFIDDKTSSLVDLSKHAVVVFLSSNGLKEIALRLKTELQLEECKDLGLIEPAYLQKLDWLAAVPKRKLLALCQKVVGNCMSPDTSDSEDTVVSQSSTRPTLSGDQSDGSGVDSDGEDETRVLVAARNEGHVDNFDEHMQKLIDDFTTEDTGQWTPCMLIWSSFLREATVPKSELFWDWEMNCISSAAEDAKARELIFLEKMHDFITCDDDMVKSLSHPQLDRIRGKVKDYERDKRGALAVAVVDCMVQKMLCDDKRLSKWKVDVIKDWYDSKTESCEIFLMRGNDFLRSETRGIKFGKPISANSYIVLMMMSPLVWSLIFEHLCFRKLQVTSRATDDSILYGFRLFIGVSQVQLKSVYPSYQCFTTAAKVEVFNLADSDMPTRGALDTVVQGLKCLTLFPDAECGFPIQAASEPHIGLDTSLANGSKYLTDEDRRMCSQVLDIFCKSKHVSEIDDLSRGRGHLLDLRRRLLDAKRYTGEAEKFYDYVDGLLHAVELCYDYQEHDDILLRVRELRVELKRRWAKSMEKRADRERTLERMFYEDCRERDLILAYLRCLLSSVEEYVDSASGDKHPVEAKSIALELFKHGSFLDELERVAQADFVCPLTRCVMRDPVTCSDGKTYERSHIEMWFQHVCPHDESRRRIECQHCRKSPLTQVELEFEETQDGKMQLKFEPNVELLEKIQQSKDRQLADLQNLKERAEGEVERRLFCNRYGHDFHDRAPNEESKGILINSAEEFLYQITDTATNLACLTGPPASGKTVTMHQIACAAVNACREQMKNRKGIPFLPLFMRGAELTCLLSDPEMRGRKVENLRDLVALYLAKCDLLKDLQGDADNLKSLVLNLFDFDQTDIRLLIFIDGLDEAAFSKELIEACVDKSIEVAYTAHSHLRVILSTREHSYLHSRACFRLLDFDIVKMQPLDSNHQRNLIENRLKGKVSGENIDKFLDQLEKASQHDPDMATSPYLLSLIIEVYKSEGIIPANRVELYTKQVEGVISRCVRRRIEAEAPVEESGCNETLVHAIENLRVGDLAGEKAALFLSIEFLEELAFSCQMRDFTRDFKSTSCTVEKMQGWRHGPETFLQVEKLLFQKPEVGLLTCLANDEYRFSHLTIQEYLAARCSLRLCGHVSKGLVGLFSIHKAATTMEPLHPLHSHWKREVLKFSACMLKPEAEFENFAALMLAEEEGTGIYCEIVQDILAERGKSEGVARMLRDKMREIRNDKLLVGLCHPSMELRTCVLSEIRKFRALNPIEGDIITQLKQMASDAHCAWNKRVAAILSLSHIGQMEDIHGSCRRRILKWMLSRLVQDHSNTFVSEMEILATIKGLGNIFKSAIAVSDETSIELCTADDSLLLNVLEQAKSLDWLAVAISDFRMISDGILEFLLGNPAVISKGMWPMKHLHQISDMCARSQDIRICSRLSEALVRRLHALSFREEDRQQLNDSLQPMLKVLPTNEVCFLFLDRLKFGTALQRVRVLEAASNLNVQFVNEVANQLAQRLLLEPDEGTDSAALTMNYATASLERDGHEMLERDGHEMASDALLSPTTLQVTAALTFNDVSDVSELGDQPAAEIVDKSLLAYILIERPTLIRFLLYTLRGCADDLEHRNGARQYAVAKLSQFQLQFEENRTIIRCVKSVVYDIIARLENENESFAGFDELSVIAPVKFSSLPSVVSWNSHNCCNCLPPTMTLQSLEEILGRTIARDDLMEVLNPIKDVDPYLQYVCAMLWESTGLTPDRFMSDVIAKLSLTTQAVLNAEKHYRSLQLFKDPWVLKVLDPQSNCGHLLVDTKEADVIFSVGYGKSIQNFPAHWFVLVSRNAYFRSLFEEKGCHSKDGEVIPLDGISSGALKVLFRFLYANELPAREDCGEGLGLGEMVQAAKRFKAGELHEHCHKLFVQGLSVGNAISRLVLVHDQRMEQLQEAVMEYLKQNSHAFQREAMESLDILNGRPDLVDCSIKITKVLCSGLATSVESLVGSHSSPQIAGPWILDFRSRDQVWVWHMCNALKFDRLGRFVFPIVLRHIRDTFLESPTTASNNLQPLAAGILDWKPRTKEQEVERQLLLKELCIGKRAMQMPIWTGLISMPRQYHEAPVSILNQVDAFFSSPQSSDGYSLSAIGIQAESVLMEMAFKDPTCGWKCNINLAPTIQDFQRSIKSAKERNVRLIHLSGHTCVRDSGCSFLWNADESQKGAVEFNSDSISLILGTVAGKNGPLECAVLNSCDTLKLAKSTRMRGVPHVVCWHEKVGDEIAQEFTEKFYRALVRNSTVSARDYRMAFMDTANELQNSQRANSSHLPANSSLQTTVSGTVRGMGGKRFDGLVRVGVVQFLSEDGDSRPTEIRRHPST